MVLRWIFNAASSFVIFQIQKYQNEPKFTVVYLHDNLTNKIKDGVFVLNLLEYANIGTHWVVTCFDSFVVELVPKEIILCKNKKNIVTNINRVQACNSIMSRFFCIGFIDYMLAFRTFIGCTYLISPHNFKKNDKIILKHIKMGEPSDIYIQI